MVKSLDDMDHIGIALWRAAANWKQQFRQEMAQRGYPWHLGARGEVLAFLGPSGVSQAQLSEKMGLSKQAVQQLVDHLAVDGVIRRVPDPADKRARKVELTDLGLNDYAEREKVKRQIEADYRAVLGEPLFTELKLALARLGPRKRN